MPSESRDGAGMTDSDSTEAVMGLFRILIFLIIAAIALPALAFDRPFPTNAKNGKLVITDYPQIELDGKPRLLSGGARIWSQDNLTVVPNALGSDTHVVVYTEDMEGAIDRVWMLTAEEVAALPAPKRRFFFIK